MNYSFAHNDTLLNWISTLDLVCISDSEYSFIRYLPFLGIFVGSIIFLPLSDIFGRKKLVLVGLLVFSSLSLTILLIRSVMYLKIFLFMQGMILPTVILIPYIHLLEFVHKDYRAYFGIVVIGLYSASYLIIALIFKCYSSWRVFYTVLTIESGLALVTYTFFIPESPRFYISDLDFLSAKLSFFFISKINQHKTYKGRFKEEN